MLSSLIESSPDHIYFKDWQGRFLRINKAMAKMLWLQDPAEAVGKTDSDFFGEIHASQTWKDERHIMTTGEPIIGKEEREDRTDGRVTWVSTTKMPLLNTTGQIIGIMGISRDITERKQAEAARTQLSAQLKIKNAELEQVVFVASHDLRSPLVNIDGYSKELAQDINELRQILVTDPVTKTSAEVARLLEQDIPDALRFIRTSTAKMDALLAGLLKLSRSGRAALMIELLDMNHLISTVADSSLFQIKEAGIELKIGDLPRCIGDAVQVNQVFSNLLENALKYLDSQRPGVIRISGQIEGERCVYCVEDNGVGIAPSHQQKIFEIFHRLEPSKSRGEGLGLTLVRQILGKLSGEIWVESVPGKGSCFYVALPTG